MIGVVGFITAFHDGIRLRLAVSVSAQGAAAPIGMESAYGEWFFGGIGLTGSDTDRA